MSCTCSHAPYTVTIPVRYQFITVSSELLIVQCVCVCACVRGVCVWVCVCACVCEVVQFQMSATICCSYGIANDCSPCSLISQ